MTYQRTSHYQSIYGILAAYPRVVGGYYPSPAVWEALAGSMVLNNNEMRCIAYPVSVTMTIDQISAYVQTTDAGKEWRLGIYLDNGSGYPSQLLIDAGAISTTVGGNIAAAIADTKLYAGMLYYLAYCSNTNVAKIAAALNGYACDPRILGSANVGYKGAQAYGALPNPYPAGHAMENYGMGMYVRLKSVP